MAEVEVDTETGIVRVLKVVAVHDIGKALNSTQVEGQTWNYTRAGSRIRRFPVI